MSQVNSITNVDQNNVNNIKLNRNSKTSTTDFSSYLSESKSLDDIFKEAAQKYNVSEDLLKAIGKAESNFDAKAVSRCGAQGVMQLMPATATSLGVTDAFDAEQNIMGGAKYISGLLKKYDGETSLALAAYNAGSGNVAKYGGIPPFEETQNYVKKVVNYMNQSIDTETTYTKATTPTTVAAATTNVVAPKIYNNSNVVTSESEDTSILAQDLDAIFSYDDYLLFMDKFLENDEEKDTEEDPNYFASKNINYNIPVMSLLNSKI